jgi:DNA-binding MarR family transcriptional regulator
LRQALTIDLSRCGEATTARRRDVFQLTNDELSILCWLRISNGQAILSASAVAENSLFVVPDRLLQDGYVRTQMLPTTVHYILTESGREVLEICESTAYFAAVAKRRWPRANTPEAIDRVTTHPVEVAHVPE